MPLLAIAPQEERLLPGIVHGWHRQLMTFVGEGLPRIAVALLIAAIVGQLAAFFAKRLRRRADAMVGNGRRAAQLRTVAGLLRATTYSLLGFYVLVELLGAIGVPLGPFIASAGVIGLGISFGAQSLFKDILNGLFILIEDQFAVGDTVKIATLQGTVEDLTLRCTKLRDGDGTLYIVPNSQIATVSNLSRDFSVASMTVSVGAHVNPDRVLKLLRELAREVRQDEAFREVVLTDPDVPGVDRISAGEVLYPVSLRVQINQRDGVLRELRRRILIAFEREGIPLGATTSILVIQNSALPPTADTAQ